MKRSRLRLLECTLRISLLACLIAGFSSLSLADSHEEEPTIELGAGDLGKSREELGSRSVAVKPEVRQQEKEAPKQEIDEQLREGAEDEKAKKPRKRMQDPKRMGKKHGDPHGKKGRQRAGEEDGGNKHVKSFDRCLEKSIRAGNNLDESTRVCRALFP